MAQSGYTPILIYASGTATNVPLAANMTSSASGAELALNYADGKLYYKNSAGVVTLLVGTGGAGVVAGSNTQVQYNNNGVFGASANMTFNGTTLTVAGLSNTGNTTLGDASADTVTVNGTITSNLIFTDNTYDIGASGATRPRTGYFGTSIFTPLLDATNVEVTNIKALDGTASATIANSTGVMTIGSSILTTTDINGGTIDGTTIGANVPAVGVFTNLRVGTATSDELLTINGSSAGFVARITNTTASNPNGLYINSTNAIGTGSALRVDSAGTSLLTLNTTGLTLAGALSVTGSASIQGLTVGRGAGAVASNTAVGVSALAANTSGASNTALGYYALQANTASDNTAVGFEAGKANTTGVNNTAVGRSSLTAADTASNNTALGYLSGLKITTADNIFIGSRCGYEQASGIYNVFIGNVITYGAASNSGTGSSNTMVGYSAGGGLSSGSNNTALGHQALNLVGTASNNTAVGYQALTSIAAAHNTAVGYQASYTNTAGIGVTAVGSLALLTATGRYVTAIGYQAGRQSTTGDNNLYVGTSAGYNCSGSFNTYVGALNSANIACGEAMTSGSKNTILGGYSGNQGGTNVPTLDIRTGSNNVVLSDGDGVPLAVVRGQESAFLSKAFASKVTLGGNRVSVNYDIYIPNEGQTAGAGFLVWAATNVDSQTTYNCWSLAAIQCTANATSITTSVISSGGSNGTISFSALAGAAGVVILRVSFNKSASSGSGNYTSTDSITIIGA